MFLCQMWSVLNLYAINYVGVFTKNYENVLRVLFQKTVNCHSSMEVGLLGIVCIEIVTFINVICRLNCVSMKQHMPASA